MGEETEAVEVPTGFNHVRRTVTDIQRSKNFYRWLLGREPGSDFSDQIDEPGAREDPSRIYGGCSFTLCGQTLGLRPVGTPGGRFDPTRAFGLAILSVQDPDDINLGLAARIRRS